ncbi:hypothetical protein ROZALSC1DRAFT_29060 [Rozella allomycis CSF55]|uniref:Uncharacterized protein n=1 Tax=Rozella allomycis (strain CSF55) TaxID=988480 RepID=A0A4P9YIW3_ROZAC|nr:hypothetical protein ROZALSC1DRAFT_29060 [Rozella allomycis CSF55]
MDNQVIEIRCFGESNDFREMEILVCLSFLISIVYGHSYLVTPLSRTAQYYTKSGCRADAIWNDTSCFGPCDSPNPLPSTHPYYIPPATYQRGSSMVVEWARQNHTGGFVRLSIVPQSSSNNRSAFDASVLLGLGIFIYFLDSSDAEHDYAFDDVLETGKQIKFCKTSLKIPDTLPDGPATLQWVFFGGHLMLGDYYSCTDINISGGIEYKSNRNQSTMQMPSFQGGDNTYPGQSKCKYYNTNEIGRCKYEPCQSGTGFYGNAFPQQGDVVSTNTVAVVESPVGDANPILETPKPGVAPYQRIAQTDTTTDSGLLWKILVGVFVPVGTLCVGVAAYFTFRHMKRKGMERVRSQQQMASSTAQINGQ